MKVVDALARGTTLSFEFFPPKTEEQEKRLFDVLSRLKEFDPDFASVTYGAMGTTREKTLYWVKQIKEKFGIAPVAHLTCVAADREGILRQIREMHGLGVNNILALRGDPPEGQDDFVPPKNGFRFARELVAAVTSRAQTLDALLAAHARNWRVSRMPAVDRNVLRLAVYELRDTQTPVAVVIDEAVDLARRFGGDASPAFVNGVLDAVAREVRAA